MELSCLLFISSLISSTGSPAAAAAGGCFSEEDTVNELLVNILENLPSKKSHAFFSHSLVETKTELKKRVNGRLSFVRWTQTQEKIKNNSKEEEEEEEVN